MDGEQDREGLMRRRASDRGEGGPALERILDQAHEAFVSLDDEGRIRAWNREAERTFGWAREAVLGERLSEVLIPPRYRDRHERGLQHFLMTGEGPLLNKRIEIAALHRNGHELPIELTISALADGGRWSFHAFLHDISDRRRAAELQARLATLVEHAAEAIVSLTPAGVITSWNPGAERLYGWSAEEVVGRVPEGIIPERRIAEQRGLVSRVMRGESVVGFETERIHKDGRRIDVSLTISPIVDDAGRVAELAVFAHDITTSKDAQRTLVRAYEELRHASDLKTHLVAVASHEIRTPLTSIVGFASTLVSRWDDIVETDRLKFLGLIESQGRRLHRLVDDVLLFSRVEARAGTGTPSSVDLAALVHDVVAELRIEADTTVDVRGPAVVAADQLRVHQIVLNVLANATAYGEPPYRVSTSADAETVTVRIADCGAGVPEAFVPSLFEAYTRAFDEHKPQHGSGLGLAIARGLATEAGGDLWYEPNRPRGACFCLRLPRSAPAGDGPDASK